MMLLTFTVAVAAAVGLGLALGATALSARFDRAFAEELRSDRVVGRRAGTLSRRSRR